MNYVGYVLDASGSMSSHVAKVIELTKASVGKLKKSDRVTIATFESTGGVKFVCSNAHADDVIFSKASYKLGGYTNLLDSVDDVITEVMTRSPNDTYLFVILTDGGENASKRVTEAKLIARLKKLQMTDRVTFAWLVPPTCVAETVRLGIDPSNIFAWTNVEEAASALAAGQGNLEQAKAEGKMSLRSGFFANVTTSKKEIRKEMTNVTGKVQRAVVKKRESIREFCTREFGGYVRGNAMYELTEPETVQDYKEVALIDKRRPHEILLGGRKVLGLPDGEVRLKPGNLGHYRAFIGSKSLNRATDVGTEVLYGDQIGIVQSTLVKSR